jgi:hypothetical protein
MIYPMNVLCIPVLLSQLATAAASSSRHLDGRDTKTSSWNLAGFKSLVTFGDSYTDESRYNYFATHNGSAPPPGWIDPPVSLPMLYIYLIFTSRKYLPT